MQTVHDISLWLLKCGEKTGHPVCSRAQERVPSLLQSMTVAPNLPQSWAVHALSTAGSEQHRAGCWERRCSPSQASSLCTAASISLSALQRGFQRAKGRVS